MSKRKLVSLLMALFLVISIFASCTPSTDSPSTSSESTASSQSSTSDSTEEESSEASEAAGTNERTPAKISMLRMNPATTTIDPWYDTAVGKALQELTNVELDIEFLVGSDQRQKASLLIAAGEYPDIIHTGDTSGDLYAAAALIPLDNYIETLPNLSAAYSETLRKLSTQEDGHIYWLGQHATENAVYPNAGYYLSMDLLKQNDYPVVTDFEEWQNLIIDYVKNNPETNGQPTIGISVPTDAWRASAIQYGGSRFLVGYQNDGLTVVDPDTLEAKIIMDQDFQKEFMHMLFRLWNEGVADPEMFMQTDEQYLAKVASGRVVGLYDQRGFLINGLDALEQNSPENMLVAFPVVLPGITTERYRGPRTFAGGMGLAISVSAKDPDRVAQFLDDLASEEAQILLRWGIEGEDYSVAADGTLEKSAEQWADYAVAENRQVRGIKQMEWFHLYPDLELLPNSKTMTNPENTDAYVQNVYKDYELDFLSNYADRGYTSFVSWFNPSYDSLYEPGWSIRQRIDTQDPRKIAGETALEITLEYAPKLVQAGTEENFDAIWDQFAAELAELPLREYEELATQMIKESAPLYQS
ncbi:MAG: extracellular solute-binding protein [Oscillospiraceae bacterium]